MTVVGVIAAIGAQLGFVGALLATLYGLLITYVVSEKTRNPAVFLLLLFVPATPVLLLSLREDGARSGVARPACANHLKMIGLALHNYADRYGSLPPAYTVDENGKRLHSWRTLILPFMEELSLHAQMMFDESWNSPLNHPVSSTKVEWFVCPDATNGRANETNYFAGTGPGTAWNGTEGARFSDFQDGTSNTILVIEVVGAGVAWAEPKDVQLFEIGPLLKTARRSRRLDAHPGGFHVLFADGSVRFITATIAPAKLKALLTIAGGERVSDF
jgi:prepilin-type processing-associated H-X9-DG protein